MPCKSQMDDSNDNNEDVSKAHPMVSIQVIGKSNSGLAGDHPSQTQFWIAVEAGALDASPPRALSYFE